MIRIKRFQQQQQEVVVKLIVFVVVAAIITVCPTTTITTTTTVADAWSSFPMIQKQKNKRIHIQTRNTIVNSKIVGKELLDYLSTPNNWPNIVATSNKVVEYCFIENITTTDSDDDKSIAPLTTVEAAAAAASASPTNILMKENDGRTIVEYLGIPGGMINFVSLKWICELYDSPHRVLFRSYEGIQGIAHNCSLQFDVVNTNDVMFTVEYDAVSFLGLLAAPILKIDNWLTLNVLLPLEVC